MPGRAAKLRMLTVIVGVASLLIMGAAAGILGHFIARSAFDNIAVVAQNTAQSLNQLFSNAVWPRYSGFITSAHEWDAATLALHPASRDLLAEADMLTAGTRILKFKIYNPHGLTVFSSRPEEIGSSKYNSPGLQKALTGQITSQLEHRARFAAANGDLTDIQIVQSYLPVRAAAGGPAIAVLEVYIDVTEPYALVRLNVREANVIMMLVLAVAFLMIVTVTYRAERELESRRRENSELAAARQQAETANRAKSLFLANMSHELRTPLNAIIGFTEMIRGEYLGPLGEKRYLAYTDHILDAGRHLLLIINDVLDLSKIEAGKMAVEARSVDAAELIRSTLRLVERDAIAAGIALAAELPDNLPEVKADAGKLRQVLLNLLSNAVKFTAAGGRVTVTAARGEKSLLVYVNDTGIGIDPRHMAQALAPFGQIGHPFVRQAGGTGLGLPLSKQLVELMGGELLIDSKPGVGTSVRISLPLNAAPAAPSVPPARSVEHTP